CLRDALDDEVSERVDEARIEPERLGASEVWNLRGFGEVAIEDVDLVERLDMIGDEADRNREHLLDAAGGERRNRVVRRRLEPLHGSDLALVRERVLERPPESLEHEPDRLLRLPLVRIAALDVAHRDAVRRE